MYHNGLKETLTQLKSQFWIAKGCQVVKRLIQKFLASRKLEGLLCKSPTTASLPECRVKDARPFKYTGANYYGPVYIKTGDTADKSYLALMIYVCSRMAHSELSKDLSVQSFYKYLKQFSRMQRMLKLIIFDSRKSFKASYLKNFIRTDESIGNLTLPKLHGRMDYLRG